ncbi:GGDEF domain-containing protein [Aureimonas endophytica]|uniref:diguanylate cyclase n=1 Tax=Aureimonas endophytica TaxID=2027858 RepID=A0A916ZYK9_9HYPH|nr:sensor domain-containing diguanylate cyclase [Aureimonas endophytica]GGE19354.1 GGDEF domain-containing protein [Aureimonas endophytica]
MHDALDHILALSEDSAALIGLYDPADRLRYANAAFRAAFFVGPAETPTFAEILRRNHAAGRSTRIVQPDFEAWLASAVSRRAKLRHRRVLSDLLDGRWLSINENVLPNGWSLFVGLDVTDLRSCDLQLQSDRDAALKAAQTDELTGISNRRHIMAVLASMITGELSGPMAGGCACLLDIDHFKRINDSFGHPAGDAVITDIARALQAAIRPRDALGRVGGEEFLLVLPETSFEDGEALVEKLLRGVATRRPLVAQPSIRITCSAGLVAYRRGESVEAVYARADKALYAAKAGGRNRLCKAA